MHVAANDIERRSVRRLKTFQVASLSAPGELLRAHMLNVSSGGALCHAAAPPSETSTVMLTVWDLNVFARVAWRNGSRFGLRFDASLDPDMLLTWVERDSI